VVVAMWLAAGGARPSLRALLGALAVLVVASNLSWGAWARTPDVPAFFTNGAYRACIARNANVIAFPVGPRGDSMIWQADSGFWFRMAGGYITPVVPRSFTMRSIQHVTTADFPAALPDRDPAGRYRLRLHRRRWGGNAAPQAPSRAGALRRRSAAAGGAAAIRRGARQPGADRRLDPARRRLHPHDPERALRCLALVAPYLGELKAVPGRPGAGGPHGRRSA